MQLKMKDMIPVEELLMTVGVPRLGTENEK